MLFNLRKLILSQMNFLFMSAILFLTLNPEKDICLLLIYFNNKPLNLCALAPLCP
jgi:hypothetical protein